MVLCVPFTNVYFCIFLKPFSLIQQGVKKLRRLPQRKRHITKIELCVSLSVLRLFRVGHVAQNRRSALSLAWHKWFSCKGKERKIYCCGLALSSEPHIRKFHVVVWQTTSIKLHQKAYRTCSTIIFPHSTNQIIDLWRCRCRYQGRRQRQRRRQKTMIWLAEWGKIIVLHVRHAF